ncbi:MAG: aldo/keto reductase [Myxococcota bacterium]
MRDRDLTIQGIRVPAMMYGTAWKEEDTQACVEAALSAGFRAIDTANQRKHYFEAGVGRALSTWWAAGNVRDDLFLQTKFTYLRGQDQRLPYDPDAAPNVQVEQSFNSSLAHLGVDQLDSYVLHGPSDRTAWTETDRIVWRTMEGLKNDGRTRLIGVSNVRPHHLRALLAEATVPPAFVQNRCYAIAGWDEAVRGICAAHGVVYQGFSLLTANRRSWGHPKLKAIADRLGATPAQTLFAYARGLGILPLTGTTDPVHMRQDLESLGLRLTEEDREVIGGLEG